MRKKMNPKRSSFGNKLKRGALCGLALGLLLAMGGVFSGKARAENESAPPPAAGDSTPAPAAAQPAPATPASGGCSTERMSWPAAGNKM